MKVKFAVLVAVTTILVSGAVSATPASAAVANPHFNYRVIMVEDHTSSRWPVRASVSTWATGARVSIRYGRCVAGAGCVRVYDSYQGRNGQSGQTHMSWNGTTKHLNTVTIRFNDSYALSSRMARQAVQHELGHSFGITYHAKSLSTCMYYKLSNAANPLPAAADKRLLNTIY